MKKTLSALLFATMLLYGCNEDENPKSGDFYVEASITPALEDQRWFIGNDTYGNVANGGNLLKTDPLRVNSGDNISLVTGIIESTDQCHTVTLDFYYAGKRFESRVFEMEGFLGVNLFQGSDCKDGYEKPFNVIIPD
ncbi:hypothetical protein [Algoriphagus formosus]|uniref:Lipoprotein n=1 Tax=Algoriphagus formosus TaxID=2007308 RepID=A0A4R5UW28_9BACT|nr:hypothetical protein [Algoriphagus aquimaris]TDK43484.1 hypothetical protein E1898_12825 [Algoriphagus aquimaris]